MGERKNTEVCPFTETNSLKTGKLISALTQSDIRMCLSNASAVFSLGHVFQLHSGLRNKIILYQLLHKCLYNRYIVSA